MPTLPLPRRIADLPEPSEPGNPHSSPAHGVLRPVVFGANDGLVSNLALVMGVAGAAPDPGVIVLAGIAGLLAGAFSMGVGEYVSVQSQLELLEYQTELQRRQLRETPDEERAILVRLYMERGFTNEEATHFAGRIFEDPEHAVSLLLHEEVGLDRRSIGSPLAAGIGSFTAFSLGALIPLVPFLLATGTPAFVSSIAASLGALFLLGVGISVLTHRSLLYTSIRQVILGGVAAAVTYGVGAAIGVSVIG